MRYDVLSGGKFIVNEAEFEITLGYIHIARIISILSVISLSASPVPVESKITISPGA